MLKTRFISCSCNKKELVNTIVEIFTKMVNVSNGEKFALTRYANSFGIIKKEKQLSYSKKVYNLLLLLVTIIKMPKIKIVRKRSTNITTTI